MDKLICYKWITLQYSTSVKLLLNHRDVWTVSRNRLNYKLNNLKRKYEIFCFSSGSSEISQLQTQNNTHISFTGTVSGSLSHEVKPGVLVLFWFVFFISSSKLDVWIEEISVGRKIKKKSTHIIIMPPNPHWVLVSCYCFPSISCFFALKSKLVFQTISYTSVHVIDTKTIMYLKKKIQKNCCFGDILSHFNFLVCHFWEKKNIFNCFTAPVF